LLILGIFKYYNFFVESFVEMFSLFGKTLEISSLKIILPVGISFYTFQALSYSIDVYRGKIEPTHDIIAFFAFVSFFPQLVAGPIERASNLLPQFNIQRNFDYAKAVDGMRQILWGLFKKIAVADNCALVVNEIFNNYNEYSGSTLSVGAIYFSFQIYCDFSGYSDIAIGTARLFGFSLMRNFAYPYFSRDIAEFWRRWHISLTTWFRDYIYIPLGGSRVSRLKVVRNVWIIFLVSGFWHGANWTFVVWGAYHAILFMPLLLLGRHRKNTDITAANRILPSLKEFIEMVIMFALVVIGWVIFRAENIGQATSYLNNMFSPSIFTLPEMLEGGSVVTIAQHRLPYACFLMIAIEWIGRSKAHALQALPGCTVVRWILYLLIIFVIVILNNGEYNEFIYFQF
jgi:D-alanyl-lipoteichoic acid acyltransferase DltB (MBOAT superfamily)